MAKRRAFQYGDMRTGYTLEIVSANWRTFMMRTFDPATWPPHIRKVFAAIREVMRSDRLYPEDLSAIPYGDGSILPHHFVVISHVAAREIGGRKGRYIIKIEGPTYAGQWDFSSGEVSYPLDRQPVVTPHGPPPHHLQGDQPAP
jgi:hypothetical protein